jgi:glutamyl-tRNA synthetase
MQRLDRYAPWPACCRRATAYHCYCQPEELDAMREAQRARGDKPRYDGRWRPEPGKPLPACPQASAGRALSQSGDGEVTWDDLVKGRSRSPTAELDDLIIVRPARRHAHLQLLRRGGRLGHAASAM